MKVSYSFYFSTRIQCDILYWFLYGNLSWIQTFNTEVLSFVSKLLKHKILPLNCTIIQHLCSFSKLSLKCESFFILFQSHTLAHLSASSKLSGRFSGDQRWLYFSLVFLSSASWHALTLVLLWHLYRYFGSWSSAVKMSGGTSNFSRVIRYCLNWAY